MLFLWQSSVDKDKISSFPNFQLIPRLRLWVMNIFLHCILAAGHYVGYYYVDIITRQFDQLLRQTYEFARNILHTNIMYLKASADVKIATFLKKNGGGGGWDCGSRNGPFFDKREWANWIEYTFPVMLLIRFSHYMATRFPISNFSDENESIIIWLPVSQLGNCTLITHPVQNTLPHKTKTKTKQKHNCLNIFQNILVI